MDAATRQRLEQLVAGSKVSLNELLGNLEQQVKDTKAVSATLRSRSDNPTNRQLRK